VFRPVLAVALAVALLAVTLPAVDDARAERAATQVDAEVGRLAERMRLLQRREDPAPTRAGGPRWYVTIHLPERSWTSDGVDYLAIGAVGNGTTDGLRVAQGAATNGTVLVWRTDSGRRGVTYLQSVQVRSGSDGAPVLHSGGSHRLALSLVRTNGTTAVAVWRSPA